MKLKDYINDYGKCREDIRMIEDANVGCYNYTCYDSRNMNVVTDCRCS